MEHILSVLEEGEDYIGVMDEQLSFSEDVRTACFNVTILNDGVCEDFEYFTVSLSATAQRVIPSPSTGYIIIRDPPLCSQCNRISSHVA